VDLVEAASTDPESENQHEKARVLKEGGRFCAGGAWVSHDRSGIRSGR
jgi:hypothetical protein